MATPVRGVGDPDSRAPALGAGQPLGAYGFTLLMMVCSALSVVDRQVISLLVEPLKVSLKIDDTQVGLVQGLAFSLCYAVAALPLAFMIDRGNRARIAAGCIAAWSLATGACGLATSYVPFLLARAGTAISEAGFSPAVLSMLVDVFPRNRVARGTAIYLMGPPLGAGMALIAGGFLIGFFKTSGGLTLPVVGHLEIWQSVFVVMILPGLVLAAAVLALVREPARKPMTRLRLATERPDSRWGLVEMWRTGFLLPWVFGTALIMMITMAMNAWAPTFFIRIWGMDPHQAGKTLGPIFIAGSLAGAVITSTLSAAKDPEKATRRVMIIVLIGALFVGPAAIMMTRAPSVALALACYGAMALAANLVGTMATAPIQLNVPNAVRAQAITIGGFVLAILGSGGGPLFVGFATDHIYGGPQHVGQSIALVASLAWMAGLAFLAWSWRAANRKA